MTTTLVRAEIAHSVVDASFLAREVAERYPIKGPVTGLLLYRGMNDVYIIQTADTRYALRVWRKDYRDADEVSYELNFLDYLRQRGFPASTPIHARDGSLYFKLDAPEGERAVALYDWAEGTKFGNCLNVDTAHRMGALFAKMHLLGLEYAGPDHVFTTDNAVRFQVTVPALLDFTYDRPDDRRDYEIIGRTLAERLREIQGDDVPMGICHCDFHPSNIHVAEDGSMTFLDFDGLGEDYMMQDVQNFVWGNLFYGFSPSYGEAFEAGYDTVRPFSAREKESKELFLLAKAFRLVAGMAHSSNAVGRGTLRFQGMDWLSDYIKSRARPLGLL
ncbi:phosphotransferase [Sphingobium sp. CR2-8]|uniref:phosphotransferase enzyme family protein n=1 Tax=Sphingobium sp. CR2-8 TaxID=1306534 RepID=UPI002DBF668D|nr:phosphotransferase [Sphingobium sp. CR2-8]MEC3911474.1 phosphotransferase [Sphingobium sp. CR2-8]